MGPRPFGRGRYTPPWPVHAVTVRLQWGRDLSAAEGGTTWRPRGSRAHGFNGAATFRPRKARQTPSPAPAPSPASMGPRPFGRGRFGRRPPRPTTPSSFNGAATFRPRKAHRGILSLGGVA